MSDQELKPCPFCGGEAKISVLDRKAYKHAVSCLDCGVSGRGTAYKNDIFNTAEWNTRTPDPMLEELAGALEEIVRSLSHGLQNCRASVIAKDTLQEYQKHQQSKVQL